jgi:hypothetical protein
MADPSNTRGATRRRFLAGAAGLAAAGVTETQAENARNLPPNVADWTRQLGEGVGVRAYGNPSKYEKNVIRRTVPWLTATPESSVSFTPLHQLDGIITPNGLCFERYHGAESRKSTPKITGSCCMDSLTSRWSLRSTISSGFRPSIESIFSNALPTPGWNGAALSLTAVSTRTAWCIVFNIPA